VIVTVGIEVYPDPTPPAVSIAPSTIWAVPVAVAPVAGAEIVTSGTDLYPLPGFCT